MKFYLIIISIIYLISSSFTQYLNDIPNTRIINGFTPNRYANSHVALLYVHFSVNISVCTGALLSSQWVVTAGQCAENAVTIEVHLGVWNRTEPSPQIITVTANNIRVHPDFSTNGPVNDIALLRLNPLADITIRGIFPIPFVCTGVSSFVDQFGQACGWGITFDLATDITIVLKCVSLQVITNTECTQTWGNQIKSTNICTRTVSNRTTCDGDTGGPFVIKTGLLQRPKLVGITSFNGDPCAGTKPDVFTRISSFSTWITTTTAILCDLL